MAKLSVPAAHKVALIELTRLADAELKGLAAAIEEAPTSLQAVSAVVAKFVARDPDVAAEAIVSMGLVLASTSADAETVYADLLDTLGSEAGDTDISALFTLSRVAQIAKAIDLQSTYDRLLLQLRIVTDVRLVFPKELPASSTGIDTAVVANVLHLSYFENGRSHDISFALRANELEELRDQFDRAISKNRLVRDFVEGAHVNVFED